MRSPLCSVKSLIRETRTSAAVFPAKVWTANESPERVERLARQQQRDLLHVDDPQSIADARFRRPAHVHEQRDRQPAARRTRLSIQSVVGRVAGMAIHDSVDPRGDVELVAGELAVEQHPARAQSFEVVADRTHERAVSLHDVGGPHRVSVDGILQPHERNALLVATGLGVPFILRGDDRREQREFVRLDRRQTISRALERVGAL